MTGKPGMLQSTGSQRVGHNLVTEQHNNMVILFFKFFCGIVLLFSTVAVPFHIPTESAQGFLFLYPLPNTCYFLVFVFYWQLS